jgi:hypothetical protein
MKPFWNEKKENEKMALPLHLIFQPNQATEIFILPPTPTQTWKRENRNPNPIPWTRKAARTIVGGVEQLEAR